MKFSSLFLILFTLTMSFFFDHSFAQRFGREGVDSLSTDEMNNFSVRGENLYDRMKDNQYHNKYSYPYNNYERTIPFYYQEQNPRWNQNRWDENYPIQQDQRAVEWYYGSDGLYHPYHQFKR